MISDFVPAFQRKIIRKKKVHWSPWKDIKDKHVITDMESFSDEVRLYIRLLKAV